MCKIVDTWRGGREREMLLLAHARTVLSRLPAVRYFASRSLDFQLEYYVN